MVGTGTKTQEETGLRSGVVKKGGGEGGIEENENEYWDRDSGRDGDGSRRRRSRGRTSDDGYEK